MVSTVYIGLGSNVGDRDAQLRLALEWMDERDGIEVESVSTFLKNPAVSKVKQPEFINACAKLKTILTPQELLEFFKEMERKMGRKEKATLDPRPLDVDILFYDDEIICSEDLTIPHPLLHERQFVLTPLAEIAPDFVHPLLQERIVDLEKITANYDR